MAILRNKRVKVPRGIKLQADLVPQNAQNAQTPSSCWDQSREHRRYFKDVLKCDKSYHLDRYACLSFDRWVGRIAGDEYKTSFFSYYTTYPARITELRHCTTGVIEERRILSKIRQYNIVRKEVHDVNAPNDPVLRRKFTQRFYTWPSSFTFDSTTTRAQLKNLKKSIEACINRRTWFRKACILNCSKTIDTKSHDHILVILQILRARLVIDYNV